MTPVNIREAAEADADQIAEVLRLAFAEYRPLYTPAAFAATTPGSDLILSRMRAGPIWVAIQEEKVIGTVAAVRQPDGCYIRGMAVLPDSRARGVGRQLLTAVESFALEQGISRLYLSTTPFLDRAIRLYRQFGFRRCSEGPHDLFGTPLFTMTRNLIPKRSRRNFVKGALLGAIALPNLPGAVEAWRANRGPARWTMRSGGPG